MKRGRTWVIADPHFGHAGVCRFLRTDGTKLRPWDDPKEMTEALINNWNELVHPDDRVYLLGDVAMNRRALNDSVPRLNGRKVLVKGNHDIDKLSFYSQYFDDVRAYVVKKGFIMSHIPIHSGSLSRWSLNIHGHLHSNVVLDESGNPDRRYACVSVEHTDYRPVELTQLLNKHGIAGN